MELAGPVDVVGVGARAREEAEILLAAHRSADAEIAHEPTLRLYRVWRACRGKADTPRSPTLHLGTRGRHGILRLKAEGGETLDPDRVGKPFDRQSP